MAAMEELKKDFWADSNRESQVSKRRLVVELAQAIGGEWWTPPLTVDVVLGVAAALKAAGLKTAAALINELKLWRIEQGHSVSDSLARLLWLAKKSVSRNLGPVKRALEVKITEVSSSLCNAAVISRFASRSWPTPGRWPSCCDVRKSWRYVGYMSSPTRRRRPSH